MSRAERYNTDNGNTKNTKNKRSGAGAVFFGTLLSTAGTLIMVLCILLCLTVAVPRLFGIDRYVVISGSMEPAIPVGSVVYSKETEPSSLTPGDVIVFYGSETGGTPVTHRVVENHVEDGEVITKGDANAGNDLAPVLYQNITGKVIAHVPVLGYIVSPLSSMAGKIGAMLIIAGAYLLTVIGSKIRR